MKRYVKRLSAAAGPIAGLLIAIALFAALEPAQFVSFTNLKTVLAQSVIVALGAIGMTYVIATGGIDLSIGSVIALASVVGALVLDAGLSAWLALLCAVGVGGAVGATNGALVAGLRIVPFIVTLGTMSVARGVAKALANEQMVSPEEGVGWIAELVMKTPSPSWLLVSRSVWLTLALAALAAFVLHRTVLGVHVLAVGSNEATARLCGVRVGRVKIAAYTIAGVCAGLAGVVTIGRLSQGDPTTAIGAELDIIAAVVLGGGALSGGRGSISGSLLGAFFMAVLANGCQIAGVPSYAREILVGVIIIAAAALDRLRQREG